MKADYNHLLALSKEIATFHSILQLLSWDEMTYMPEGAASARSEQMALLSEHIHQMRTSAKFANALESFVHLGTGRIKKKGLTVSQRAALKAWHRDYLRDRKLPGPFVRKFSETTSNASRIWMEAKKRDDFALFAPHLEKIIDLSIEKAKILGFADHPYDALLEGYEPEMSTKRVKMLFSKLKTYLIKLIGEIKKRGEVDDRFLWGSFDSEAQMRLGKALMAKLPADPAHTRLDLSAHPMSIALHPQDSRITTRILHPGFFSNLSSILHESGHSFYEMGLPLADWGTPLAEPVSLTIHESQSRFWECLIGKSRPFWHAFLPLVRKELDLKVSLDAFYQGINRVTPSLIRVEADEVTYCLHIILRFELELALISKELKVTDLPAAWRAKMKEFFGIEPENDREGCLQDIHWAIGAFGYFPTYALGNMASAQFFVAFEKTHPDWEKRVMKGELAFIREWLRTEIHQFGRRYSALELIKKVTGKPFGPADYCRYLTRKFSRLDRRSSASS
jgi:carboxypeptidase Taq